MSSKLHAGWAVMVVVACSDSPSAPPAASAAAAGAGSVAGRVAPAAAGGRTAADSGTVTDRPSGQAGSPTPVAGQPAPAPSAGAAAPDAGLPDEDAGTLGPAASSCDDGVDPLALLRALAPSAEDAAKDYAEYLDTELGPVTCATQGGGSARTITQTIFVPPNAVYDGRGERLTADATAMNCDTSEGEQAEHQRPYFLLAPGASLQNVVITYPGCEGVHMMGDNVLSHVTWEDAGEDAASVRSYFPGGKYTIRDSEGHKAADKMFQFNAVGDVRIERFTGSEMGKLVRQNGGTEFSLKIDLNTVDVTGVISAVVQSDSPQCFVRYHGLTYTFMGSGDKSDRVFRDIPPANVMEY